MAKAKANTELCKGCRLCVRACPKHAIIPLEEVNKRAIRLSKLMKKSALVVEFVIRPVLTVYSP